MVLVQSVFAILDEQYGLKPPPALTETVDLAQLTKRGKSGSRPVNSVQSGANPGQTARKPYNSVTET